MPEREQAGKPRCFPALGRPAFALSFKLVQASGANSSISGHPLRCNFDLDGRTRSSPQGLGARRPRRSPSPPRRRPVRGRRCVNRLRRSLNLALLPLRRAVAPLRRMILGAQARAFRLVP